jgi:hypothetical protein
MRCVVLAYQFLAAKARIFHALPPRLQSAKSTTADMAALLPEVGRIHLGSTTDPLANEMHCSTVAQPIGGRGTVLGRANAGWYLNPAFPTKLLLTPHDKP